MITRLEVDGFKSLRNFAIDLAPFTALVGPNSSGKSNLLEALALLSHLASEPIEAAFKHGRGRAIDQFTRERGEPVRAIRFAAELLLPVDVETRQAPANRVRYELTIARERQGSGADALIVEHEHLTTIDEENDDWAARFPAFTERVHATQGRVEILGDIESWPKDVRQGKRRLRAFGDDTNVRVAASTHTALAAATLGALAHEVVLDSETVLLVREMAKQMRTSVPDAVSHALETASRARGLESKLHDGPPDAAGTLGRMLSAARFVRLDAASLHGESERIGGAALLPDASNLPTVLAALPPHVLGEIRADLVALVPGISTFDVVADKDSFRIEIELSGGDRLPARLASDGTLRALALLTALRSRPFPSIIGIEEPENGIYPGRLRALLEVLREVSQRDDTRAELDREEEGDGEPRSSSPQVVITSHSPVVLAAMHEDLDGLRFIDTVRRDGHLVTRARRIGPSAPGERGQNSVPIREVDALLSLATSEAAE